MARVFNNQGFVTYPQLENQVIHIYRLYKRENRYYVQCACKVMNNQGIMCHCNMELTREDHFRSWLRNHVHICQPGDPI